MKRWIVLIFLLLFPCALTACANEGAGASGGATVPESVSQTQGGPASHPEDASAPGSGKEDPQMEPANLQLYVDGTPVTVVWERNPAVEELYLAARRETLVVHTHAYGGFEQVGPLPSRFSRNDVQLTTQAGDIVLYSGDQLVLFFGANTWRYTRLGHIEGLTQRELAELLDKDAVTVEIKAG